MKFVNKIKITQCYKNVHIGTKKFVSFNEKIMTHSEQLSASTEEVSAFAEEALNIMEENRRKTLETKEIMSDILEVSNKLI